MKRAALLLRVSDERQAAEDRLSLDAQRRVLRERCAREGWMVVREYVGAGESAFTNDWRRRQTIMALKGDAEQGLFDVLLVHDLSRFARDEELGFAVFNLLERHGIELVNASADVDYGTPEGRMLLTIDLGLNSYWSRKVSFHIRKSKRERFELGLHVGDAPFGYRRGASTKEPLVPVPEEAEAVARAFQDYAGGVGYTEIARRWNELGLRPRSKRGNDRFTASAVQSILENDFYCGFVRYKGERRRGAHTAIISEDLFLAAQARVRRQPARAREPRLLAGLALCVACGGPIWQSRAGRGHVYYRESAKLRGLPCPNAGRMWRCDEADEEVGHTIRAMALDPAWLAVVEREAKRPPQESETRERERRELEERRRRATKAYLAGALAEREWSAELRAIDDRLAALREVSPSLAQSQRRLTGIGELWDGMTLAERREACRTLFAEVRVDTVRREVWVTPWPEFAALFALRRAMCVPGTPDRTRTCAPGSGGRRSVQLSYGGTSAS
jgi:DNA invertase Pin-like site-specific DNA recombinase